MNIVGFLAVAVLLSVSSFTSMLDENLLWGRTIDSMSGKLVKEESFIGAALAFLALCGAVAVVVVIALYLQ